MKRVIKTKEEFLDLFDRLTMGLGKDFNDILCGSAFKVKEKIQKNEYKLSDLFKICGIPYNKTYQSYYYAGWKTFTEFLGLWYYGFRSLEAIDRIMAADKSYIFAEQVYEYGMIAEFFDLTNQEVKVKETCFSFNEIPWLYEQIRILFQNCSETTAGYIIEEFVKHPRKMRIRTNQFVRVYKKVYVLDSIILLMRDCGEKFNKEEIIPVMREHGITKKTYNLIIKKLMEGAEDCEFPAKKEKVCYTPEELSFEWECGDYKFILPKKYGMIYKLNNKIFTPENTGLDVDATDRTITELYVRKGIKYLYLFEIYEWEKRGFELVNVTVRKNKKLLKNDITIIKQWCKEKNVFIAKDKYQAVEVHNLCIELVKVSKKEQRHKKRLINLNTTIVI